MAAAHTDELEHDLWIGGHASAFCALEQRRQVARVASDGIKVPKQRGCHQLTDVRGWPQCPLAWRLAVGSQNRLPRPRGVDQTARETRWRGCGLPSACWGLASTAVATVSGTRRVLVLEHRLARVKHLTTAAARAAKDVSFVASCASSSAAVHLPLSRRADHRWVPGPMTWPAGKRLPTARFGEPGGTAPTAITHTGKRAS